ncbi:MAG: non-heme iron oxygenase ferredoxin subunit [Chloroflexi bacterium]|nr:non-heme iron oxygenase ferredoxin subunit [Chloroflexota bacterium]
MARWMKFARVGEILPGERKIRDLGELIVAVFNIDGEYYAIEDVCTHDGGPVAEGELEGHTIICPRHGAHFDVRSGAVLSMPAVVPIDSYPVRIEGEDILIQLDGEE